MFQIKSNWVAHLVSDMPGEHCNNIPSCSYVLFIPIVHPMHVQIGVSLAVHVPVYLNYIVIAVWFFCHATMELTLIIFTGSSIKSHVSFYNNHILCVWGESIIIHWGLSTWDDM